MEKRHNATVLLRLCLKLCIRFRGLTRYTFLVLQLSSLNFDNIQRISVQKPKKKQLRNFKNFLKRTPFFVVQTMNCIEPSFSNNVFYKKFIILRFYLNNFFSSSWLSRKILECTSNSNNGNWDWQFWRFSKSFELCRSLGRGRQLTLSAMSARYSVKFDVYHIMPLLPLLLVRASLESKGDAKN